MNEIRPWRTIHRRHSRQIMVGNVAVGGDAPITVQTMTNTPTSDARATIDQIRRCEDAGADIIRVSCPDADSTAALGAIVRASRIPIVADIHFHSRRALEAAGRAGGHPDRLGVELRAVEPLRLGPVPLDPARQPGPALEGVGPGERRGGEDRPEEREQPGR